jgi:hypothetical protein
MPRHKVTKECGDCGESFTYEIRTDRPRRDKRTLCRDCKLIRQRTRRNTYLDRTPDKAHKMVMDMQIRPTDDWLKFCRKVQNYGGSRTEEVICVEVSKVSMDTGLPWQALKPIAELWVIADYPVPYFPHFLQAWADYLISRGWVGRYWSSTRHVKDLISYSTNERNSDGKLVTKITKKECNL